VQANKEKVRRAFIDVQMKEEQIIKIIIDFSRIQKPHFKT